MLSLDTYTDDEVTIILRDLGESEKLNVWNMFKFWF